MKRLLVATRNAGKLAELRALLGDGLLETLDAHPEVGDLDEPGETFEANARAKAVRAARAARMLALGEDSGLEVDALGGAPGVRSARYAGGHGDDAANLARLLRELDGIRERRARFVCVAALADADGKVVAEARGTCEGAIALAPRGTNGFGYDPVFVPAARPDRTLAELTRDEKSALSHRGYALRALLPQLGAVLLFCFVAIAVSLVPGESVAAPKEDLEEYLGRVPDVDDEKTFVSELGEFTNVIVAVSHGAKRSSVLTVQTDEDSETTELEVVVHGKKLLVGTTVLFDGEDEIIFFVPKAKKSIAFKLKRGKAYSFSIPSKVFFNGVKVARAKEFGKVTFLGFEDVTTPLGTFEDAAHFLRTRNIRLKAGGDVVETRSRIESWVVAGLGGVRFIQADDYFENGVLVESIPATEFLFDHGIIGGEPFPPPAPATVPGR